MSLPLILASSSAFRRMQLERLEIPFQWAQPRCDETPIAGESPQDTSRRLAQLKAQSLQKDYPNALIIGSDQVAFAQNRQWGKPMTREKAEAMLMTLSGHLLHFYTALAVLNTQTQTLHTHIDETRVKMRQYDTATVTRYLDREPDAIYCAGGAKSEGLGMCLIQEITSNDPNALIGLPMLRLIDFLLLEGHALL